MECTAKVWNQERTVSTVGVTSVDILAREDLLLSLYVESQKDNLDMNVGYIIFDRNQYEKEIIEIVTSSQESCQNFQKPFRFPSSDNILEGVRFRFL